MVCFSSTHMFCNIALYDSATRPPLPKQLSRLSYIKAKNKMEPLKGILQKEIILQYQEYAKYTTLPHKE